MVGIMERFFKIVLFQNGPAIFRNFICPICDSLKNPKGEIEALQNLFDEVQRLSKNPLPLDIPADLQSSRIFGGHIILETFWTHKKTVRYMVPGHNKLVGAETSDVIFQVSHEFLKPGELKLVDEKISFFQAKIERKSTYEIKPKQWYLMRYWPDFHHGMLFSLVNCRRVPDVCSFYLLLSKEDLFAYRFMFGLTPWEYNLNSTCLSTLFMENRLPKLKKLNTNDILKNNGVSLELSRGDCDGFLDVVWDLLTENLGVHDTQASTLLASMFKDAATNPRNPGPREHPRKRPKIGVRVRVQLKTE